MAGLIIMIIVQWFVIIGGVYLASLMRKNETRLVNETVVLEDKLKAMRSLTSDFIEVSSDDLEFEGDFTIC